VVNSQAIGCDSGFPSSIHYMAIRYLALDINCGFARTENTMVQRDQTNRSTKKNELQSSKNCHC